MQILWCWDLYLYDLQNKAWDLRDENSRSAENQFLHDNFIAERVKGMTTDVD